jgi:DNA-binding PadR family transcriptional regulator
LIELIILGFLSYNYPLTLYDIKMAMKRSTEYFASTSQGAIHPALVKLNQNGYVKI